MLVRTTAFDQPFSCALQLLPVAKYLFRLKTKTRIQLPPYKGSALHGGFGHALKKISPYYYQHIFEPGRDGARPKPFVLLPPLDTDETYQPGREFTCELTLFGSAIQHFSICHAALDYLGREMGFGNNRGKFIVEGVETALPAHPAQQDKPNQIITGRDIAAARLMNLAGSRITLHLPTRLRLKADGRLIRQAASFQLFFARLLGRLNTLSTFYGDGKIAESELRQELLRQAENIRLIRDDTSWHDLPRYSGRQKQWMKFGGLLGAVTYEGDLQPFLALLAVGEWTHVGGKTSFGLGKYVMEEKENEKT